LGIEAFGEAAGEEFLLDLGVEPLRLEGLSVGVPGAFGIEFFGVFGQDGAVATFGAEEGSVGILGKEGPVNIFGAGALDAEDEEFDVLAFGGVAATTWPQTSATSFATAFSAVLAAKR
jgi:hypothetical protein